MADEETNKDAAPPAEEAAAADPAPADSTADTAAAAAADAKDDDTKADAADIKKEDSTLSSQDKEAIITLLTERLRFFFSNANLRQDKWMRNQLSNNRGSLSLSSLLKFNTLKSITANNSSAADPKELLKQAASSEELKDLLVLEGEEIRRVEAFDYRTMGDGSHLSLWVKNVPLTKEEEDDKNKEDGDGEKKKENGNNNNNNNKPFKPRYAITRQDLHTLFEPYGRIGIIQFKYGRKTTHSEDDKYAPPKKYGGGYERGESYPLGAAVVEFESKEGMQRACEDLLEDYEVKKEDEVKKEEEDEMETDKAEEDKDEDKKEEGEGTESKKKGPKKTLEINGHKLIIKRMKPYKMFQHDSTPGSSSGKKRSRDDNDEDNGSGNIKEEDGIKQEQEQEVKFEPVSLTWSKGCVISLTNLSPQNCDREAIRSAVSSTLAVSTDIKSSGLYVDYNRGDTKGNLRLNDPKPTEMKELVDKLNDGSILVAEQKVEAKILEGEEEEEYWKGFEEFLNERKRRGEVVKRQKRWSGGRGGRGGGGGGGKGGRGRGGGGGRRGRR